MNVYDGMAIARQIEIFYAMWKNLLHVNIDKIHLLSEGFTDDSILDKLICLFSLVRVKCISYKNSFLRKNPGLNSNDSPSILRQIAGNLTDVVEMEPDIRALKARKIELVPISTQPTYKALLDYSLGCCKDEIVVISNSDIYFDDTLSCVVGKEEELKANKQLLAVTRTGAEECPDRVSPPSPLSLFLRATIFSNACCCSDSAMVSTSPQHIMLLYCAGAFASPRPEPRAPDTKSDWKKWSKTSSVLWNQ